MVTIPLATGYFRLFFAFLRFLLVYPRLFAEAMEEVETFRCQSSALDLNVGN